MKKILSILLAITMLLSVLSVVSCTQKDNTANPDETDEDTSAVSDSTDATSNNETSDTEASGTQEDDATTSENGETESELESETETEVETETEIMSIDGEYAKSIMNAAYLKGDVQARYTSSKRQAYEIENNYMSMTYALTGDNIGVSSLTTKNGAVLLENTMDVYVTMQDGITYYASNSTTPARMNMFKYGYYYYDLHFLDQNFLGSSAEGESYDLDETLFLHGNQIKNLKCTNGVISFYTTGNDPYIYVDPSLTQTGASFDSSYNAIRFSVKSTSSIGGEVFFIAGNATGHNGDQYVSYTVTSDGEWHTYTIMLSYCPNYTGNVRGIRLDFVGGEKNENIQIKDIQAVKISESAPKIVIDREFHTYSDKLNYVTNFVATEDTSGIESVGTITYIPKDKVSGIAIKDANGVHNSLDGVDFESVEYVGFIIKDAGVVGFILPVHKNSGKLEVTLDQDRYCIKQISVPRSNMIKAPKGSTANNFSVGCRIYTDDSASFDGFLHEAELERTPFDGIQSNNYLEYDALRGVYKFSIGGTSFNPPYFSEWNVHYTAPITLVGGDEDRSVYILTHTSNGGAEGACVLSEDNMLLPIPTMIFKNFAGENEESIFYAGDAGYGETLVPMVAEAGKTISFTVINAYQNWGATPLKQLSSIQFFAPYYHLSTGVTETSCIAPWFTSGRDLWTLPDFRTMSAPFWYEYTGSLYDNQPQHTHAGYHYFLEYKDVYKVYSASENVSNNIISSGLNYAQVEMNYVSDDGRIEVTYNHIEMPQTDEHRAFYEIEYKILEDINFDNFKKNFAFYTVQGYAGSYTTLGYLDENNEYATATVTNSAKFIKLGDNCPYVSLYGLKGAWENKCGNLGFVIYDSDITIGGEKYDGNFVLFSMGGQFSLTLDLETVSLKKGDTIKLYMILVPWGSELSTDDSNMREIRENTCINPLDITVINGEKIESVFVPKVRSTDGVSASFTLTGGNNNCVVRAYGFKNLTTPKIYEIIDGEMVEYVSNSSQNPDRTGASHTYDGYFVYYDNDGTYSYTFVVDMTDTEGRTFVISCE